MTYNFRIYRANPDPAAESSERSAERDGAASYFGQPHVYQGG